MASTELLSISTQIALNLYLIGGNWFFCPQIYMQPSSIESFPASVSENMMSPSRIPIPRPP